MKKVRRINLYAGPCGGKSTTAAWVFSELKKMRIETDWVQESIKFWTYIDRPPTGLSDQLKIFTNQVELEEVALRKLDVIVADAPLLMNCYYGWKYNRLFWKDCVRMAIEFEQLFPGVHIFLERGDITYSEVGRWQSEDEAKLMDKDVKDFVTGNLSSAQLYSVQTVNQDELLNLIKSKIL